MVHELLEIKDNKVDLRNFIKVPKDQQEVVLSSEQDTFFKANRFENFGDLGMNIKRMVDEFQQKAKSNQNIQTLGMFTTEHIVTLYIGISWMYFISLKTYNFHENRNIIYNVYFFLPC